MLYFSWLSVLFAAGSLNIPGKVEEEKWCLRCDPILESVREPEMCRKHKKDSEEYQETIFC